MNRLKWFTGEIGERPDPLELSYNECSYQCQYCSPEDALIWMGDGQWRHLGTLEVGDVVMGWERGLHGRRVLRESTVQALFRRVAPLQRVVLESGRSVTATPDHHWFTGRPEPRFAYQHAKIGRPLVFVADPVAIPPETEDYRLGYVRGLVDGDGCITDKVYQRPGGGRNHQRSCRVACKDWEPLERLEAFAFALGLRPHWGTHHYGTGETMPRIVVCGADAITLLGGDPVDTDEYWRGWLAGIYDAEGSFGGTLRISQYPDVNPVTYARIGEAFARFKFQAVAEDVSWRLLGGRHEILRFYNVMAPALWRQLRHAFVESGRWGELDRVAEIEPLGQDTVVSMRTSTGNYVSQGYASRNCFATLSGRGESGNFRNLEAGPTLRHITSVTRTGGNPRNITDYLTVRKYPLCFSNSVDPCSARDLPSTHETLPFLRDLNYPIVMQTRGTKRPADFPAILDMITPGSLIYMSFTGFGKEFVKEIDLGCPTTEERLEMAAMAAEAGFTVVGALNPVDEDWCPNPEEYCARMEEIAGKGVIKGIWAEPLHFTQVQARNLKGSKRGLPVLLEGAFERATGRPWELDPYWVQDLIAAIRARWGNYYFSHSLPQGAMHVPYPEWPTFKLFDLWPKPHFPTYHRLVEACREVSHANGGRPVMVSFSTYCSWLDPYREILDIELSRGDAWTLVNQRNDAGKENRLAMPKSMSFEECLRFMWRRPKSTTRLPYGAYGLKAIVTTYEDENGDIVDADYLRAGHIGGTYFREDDDTPLAVYAPQDLDNPYTEEPSHRFRLFSEIAERDPVLLAPFDPEDFTEGDELAAG